MTSRASSGVRPSFPASMIEAAQIRIRPVMALVCGAILGLPTIGNGDESQGSVRCLVKWVGEVPQARVIKLDAEMRAAMKVDDYAEEVYLMGRENGLANCVILLRSQDPQRRPAPPPLETQTLAKVGVRFEPRVLVVTPHTDVRLTNPQSPCRGFQVLSARNDNHRFSYMIFEGQQRVVRFTSADLCQIGCPLRPYARGFVLVSDTPFFAKTDAHGAARLENVPPGDYDVSLWHESLQSKRMKARHATVQVKPGATSELRLSLPVEEQARP